MNGIWLCCDHNELVYGHHMLVTRAIHCFIAQQLNIPHTTHHNIVTAHLFLLQITRTIHSNLNNVSFQISADEQHFQFSRQITVSGLKDND